MRRIGVDTGAVRNHILINGRRTVLLSNLSDTDEMQKTNKDKYIIGANRNASTVTKVSSLNADFEHIERLNTVESTRSGSIKRANIKFQKHWRRFWCCYMLAAIIFLAIFLPIL